MNELQRIFLNFRRDRRKDGAFTKEKLYKSVYDFFIIATLLLFYDQKYLNSTKSRLSNQNYGMVPEVTLILNFKSLSLKITKLEWRGYLNPPKLNKLDTRVTLNRVNIAPKLFFIFDAKILLSPNI